MVSFDISSLFTNIPLEETIDLVLNLFPVEHDDMNRIGLKSLLEFAAKNVPFLFNNEWYKQGDGVARLKVNFLILRDLIQLFLSVMLMTYLLFLVKLKIVIGF